ncbi:MAG: hypothetical protein QXS02_00060 [Candidatus Thermoplasmatota archaeon]
MQTYKKPLLITIVVLCLILNGKQCLSVEAEGTNNDISCTGELYILDDKEVNSIALSTDEVITVSNSLPDLISNLESETTYRGFLRSLVDFSDKSDDETGVMRYILDLLDEASSANLREKRVFIISYGRTKLKNPIRGFQVNLLRPSIIFWYYPGLKLLLRDKTMIVDPNPFHIRVVDGKQIGLMQGFIGVYIYIPDSSGYNTVFFMGYARRVLALDLSPATRLK